MSLSSNTAQTRELTELRNHLKWLDEERRKSSRKMAELEQRIAQQGRDLAERDQKIQELEWHVANFSERFERLPDLDSNVAVTEQRLQDLEWHLSNMNSQITRLPNPDEERAHMQEEITRAVGSIQERADSERSLLESRLRKEMVALKESEETRLLAVRQDEQVQAINDLGEKLAALQESVGILSGQLRERTGTLAAESQANISSLAVRLQEHLDAITAENKTRMDSFAAEWQTNAAEWQTRLDEAVVMSRAVELPELNELQSQVNLRLAAVDEQLAQFSERQAGFDLRLAETGQRYEQQDEKLESLISPINSRQIEIEENLIKLGNVREIMPFLDRLEQELELRQAEEVRLSNLIGTQENRLAPLADSLESLTESNSALLGRVAESEKSLDELRVGMQDFNDNWKPAVLEINRRLTPIADRMAGFSNNLSKTEAGIQTLTSDQAELRESMVNLTDDMRRNQSDIARQLEGWQATLDENKDTIERFTQQWITLSNQYKEARMAVQNFAHWQKQLEQQKREASEMLRVESNRMQSRWDGFLLEVQEKLKNFELELNQKWQTFEIENEQKWSAARRNDQLRHEELAAVDELIQKLQQDNRNLIWRVQAAQADAIKKWPRLLMEEVEKAVELNPNRRLTTSAAPRGDMSVVDAIEQGLITIDYSDETPGEF
ncbi:MAG: hypothetical protein KJ046_07075 [Anaerolineae bacterium]|nr:hypothetical protein [Anaerolineae bacterium]